jgi:hypothetical protein
MGSIRRHTRRSAGWVAAAGLAGAAVLPLATPARRAGAAEVGVQAENFTGGPGFVVVNNPAFYAGQAITTTGDNLIADGSPSGSVPGQVSYSIIFPEAGLYYLYARFQFDTGGVPPPDGSTTFPGALDDSFFVGRTLGQPAEFDVVNNTNNVYVNSGQRGTTPGGGLYPVIANLVTFSNGAPALSNAPLYTVDAPGPQTFVIAGRENGLNLDAFVFSTNAELSAEQFTAAVPGTAYLIADANGDGQVDVADLGILATNFNDSPPSPPGKAGGDFNNDGTADVSDLGILATFFSQPRVPGAGGASFEAALAAYPQLQAAVPEPAALGALAVGAFGMLARRRRSS